MTQLEKIRQAKPLAGWPSWLYLLVAAGWLVVALYDVFRVRSGVAAIHACVFAVFLLGFHAREQARINRELVAEIDALKSQIQGRGRP